jgi:hypothetical protein
LKRKLQINCYLHYYLDKAKPLDILLCATLLLKENNTPSWNAFMQGYVTGNHYGKSTIVFQPFLD